MPGDHDAFFQVIVTELTVPLTPFTSRALNQQPGKWFRTENEALAYAKKEVEASVKSGMTLCS